MFGKLVLLGSVVAVSLLVASSVQAEGGCPDGYYPLAGGCAPIPDTPRTNPQPNRPDVPTRRRPRVPTMYANSYIAVAVHPYAGDVWATWNHRTEKKSKEAALTACTQAIGSGCQIMVNGWNVSVAIARDRRDNMVLYGWGDNPDNAQSNVLKVCKDKNYDCEIVNIFTSEPLIQPANFTPIQQQFLETNPAFDFSKNYFPDRSVLRVKPVSTSKSMEQKQ